MKMLRLRISQTSSITESLRKIMALFRQKPFPNGWKVRGFSKKEVCLTAVTAELQQRKPLILESQICIIPKAILRALYSMYRHSSGFMTALMKFQNSAFRMQGIIQDRRKHLHRLWKAYPFRNRLNFRCFS